MSHTNTGIISKPVDIRGDIAAIFGRNTGDLGRLCSDTDDQGNDLNLFNFWSLKKPIRHSSIGELTEAQWKAANYGYTINSYYGNTGCTSLIAAHKAGTTWQYFKPRGASYNEWFRATDFDGYSAGATNPFVISYATQPEIGASSTSRIEIDFLDDFLQWGLFSSYAPTFKNIYLGLLAWPTNTASPQSCYLCAITSGITGQTIADIAGEGHFNYPVPSSVFTSGTSYTLVPVVMTYNSGLGSPTWINVGEYTTPTINGFLYDILCPTIQITPQNQVTPDQRVSVYVDTDNASFSGESTMNIQSVPIYITNGNSSSLTNCALYVYFKDYPTSQMSVRELGHTGSFTVNANSTGSQTVTGNLNITPIVSGIANGYYELSFTYDGHTYTKGGDTVSGGRFVLREDK